MALTSFTTFDKAVTEAFVPGSFKTHRVICQSGGKYYVCAKGKIPKGYTKLTLSEIVSVMNKNFDQIAHADKKNLADTMGYMGTRKVTVAYTGCLGALRKLLFIIGNLFRGFIGKNPAQKVFELQQKLNTSAQTAPPATSTAAPASKPAVAPAKPSTATAGFTAPEPSPSPAIATPDPIITSPKGKGAAAPAVPVQTAVLIAPGAMEITNDWPRPRAKVKDKTGKEIYTEDRDDFNARVFVDTRVISHVGYVKGSQRHAIDTKAVKEESVMYGYEEVPELPPLEIGPKDRPKTTFRVTNGDTLNVLLKLKQSMPGCNPIAIDLANSERPGGSVIQGHTAQEEEICRRSTLMEGLMRQEYPIPPYGGVYCPGVTVFRHDASTGYEFMDKPEKVAVLAVAGVDLRKKKDSEKTHDALVKDKDYTDKMVGKLRNMLRVMAANGHDTLVLGALGCGVFENPPTIVSKIFKYLFTRSEFYGRFKHVEFAILARDPHDENLVAFQEVVKEINDFDPSKVIAEKGKPTEASSLPTAVPSGRSTRNLAGASKLL